MSEGIDRRSFLAMITALSASPATALARAGDVTFDRTGVGGSRRVIVLGAGLAGLSAAYTLMRNGYEVVVLEAQGRPGGRVLTARDGLKAGGHAELGAVRIFDSHEYTNRYVERFGLELIPYESDPPSVFFMRGKRFSPPPEGDPWPIEDMTPEERADPFAFFDRYLTPGFEQLGDIFDPGWPAAFPAALGLDAQTFGEFMRAQGASTGWVDWFFAFSGNVRRLNACAVFAEEAVAGGATASSIRGGNDRLPRALAAALGERVKYRSPVVRIRATRRRVVVNYVDRQGRHELEADRCVCALPFSTLRRVHIARPFSDRKMAAIQRLRYMPAARCYFQTRSQFWRSGPLDGLNLVATDTDAGRIWNTSSQQPDATLGMLHAYMIDSDASAFTARSPRDRVRAMRRRLATLLPGSDGQVIGVAQKAWHEDPWVQGGWAWTQPDELQWMFPAMRQSEGRVHFAGEHTSLWIAWMNGALESGERAAAEIVEATAAAPAHAA